MQHLSDKEIIICIKRGEIEYFSEIVQRYTKIIYSIVRKKLYAQEEVEDLVQNTFINFYKKIQSFEEERPVLPYLFEIAKNEVRMYMRKHKTHISLSEDFNISDEKDHWVTEEEMDELLQGLTEEQKKAMHMVYEGYSYKEVSTELNKPLNTVRTIIHRARQFIQKKFNYEK